MPLLGFVGNTILQKESTDTEAGDVDEEDDDGISDRLHQHFSSSTPDIHTVHVDQRDSGVCDDTYVQKLTKGAKSVCRVVKDFIPEYGEPSCITLRVSCDVKLNLLEF